MHTYLHTYICTYVNVYVAVQHGRWAEASSACLNMCGVWPLRADMRQLAGIVLHQAGRYREVVIGVFFGVCIYIYI